MDIVGSLPPSNGNSYNINMYRHLSLAVLPSIQSQGQFFRVNSSLKCCHGLRLLLLQPIAAAIEVLLCTNNISIVDEICILKLTFCKGVVKVLIIFLSCFLVLYTVRTIVILICM